MIHEAGEAEDSGPRVPIGARPARYSENLQSRTMNTLGPEMFREKICGLVKIFGLFQILFSRQFERLTWYKWTFDVRM